jgi:hypothetical protein
MEATLPPESAFVIAACDATDDTDGVEPAEA